MATVASPGDLQQSTARTGYCGMGQLRRHNLTEPPPASQRIPVEFFLLAEAPDPGAVESLLEGTASGWGESIVTHDTPDDVWDSLILPEPQLTQLSTIATTAAMAHPAHPLVLFHGASGTGKTKAARVIAAQLNLPLITLALSQLSASSVEPLLDEVAALPPCVLVLESAHHWLGRTPTLDVTLIHQLVAQIRDPHHQASEDAQPGLVILTTHYLQAIRPSWRQQLDGIIEFPPPPMKLPAKLYGTRPFHPI